MRLMTAACAVLLLAACAAPPTRHGSRPGQPGPAPRGPTAERRDIPASAVARELALQALAHVGIPYRFGGSSPETGFDCSGLVQYVYGRAGLTLPRSTEAMSQIGVEVIDLQPGDLVFFDTLRKPFSHVGIYLGEQRFIHAPTTGGSVELVDMRQRYWQTRFNGARRLDI